MVNVTLHSVSRLFTVALADNCMEPGPIHWSPGPACTIHFLSHSV